MEATKDLYFPLVLVASVLYLLFTPTHWEHLPIFLATIAGAVAVKTLYAVVASRDLHLALYPVNQAMVSSQSLFPEFTYSYVLHSSSSVSCHPECLR